MHNISGELYTLDISSNMFSNDVLVSSNEANMLISVNKNPHARSKVYLGKALIVKHYNAEDLYMHDIDKIKDEILLLKQLNHKGVSNLLSTFVSGTNIAYVMPFMECGSCQDLVESEFPTGLPECWIFLIVKNLLEVLNFIHMNGIIHRSIKARHILLNRYGGVKLTGFRYAIKKPSDNGGTVYEFPYDSIPNLKWLSPEILQQSGIGYTEKSDVYSLGMTICELANGIPPFENLEPKKLLLQKISGAIPLIFDSSTHLKFESSIKYLSIPPEQLEVYSTRAISANLHSLKNNCCISNFDERPTVDELMNNEIFVESDEFSLTPSVLPLIEFKKMEDIGDVESLEWNF
ncbi:STE20-related kinase adapter protein alpha-like [Nilaparvata lugens]|uniref:STE20-related kinase adapter protein alpha-like n=1 Tax=Nilaparvata lugens TaxID=108931 RepID=UPI00193D7720|nr:STE20-related kinase adapter protein alpha-like [Nilaparvata lugens]